MPLLRIRAWRILSMRPLIHAQALSKRTPFQSALGASPLPASDSHLTLKADGQLATDADLPRRNVTAPCVDFIKLRIGIVSTPAALCETPTNAFDMFDHRCVMLEKLFHLMPEDPLVFRKRFDGLTRSFQR